MSTIQFNVPGMSCDHCVRAITSQVGRVAGVKSVQVALDSKVVTIGYDAEIPEQTIISAIHDAGFEEVARL